MRLSGYDAAYGTRPVAVWGARASRSAAEHRRAQIQPNSRRSANSMPRSITNIMARSMSSQPRSATTSFGRRRRDRTHASRLNDMDTTSAMIEPPAAFYQRSPFLSSEFAALPGWCQYHFLRVGRINHAHWLRKPRSTHHEMQPLGLDVMVNGLHPEITEAARQKNLAQSQWTKICEQCGRDALIAASRRLCCCRQGLFRKAIRR
jgi:hypothetical protein